MVQRRQLAGIFISQEGSISQDTAFMQQVVSAVRCIPLVPNPCLYPSREARTER